MECLWTGLKTAIKTTCVEILGIQKRHNEDWFDDNDAEVEQMIAEKVRDSLFGRTTSGMSQRNSNTTK